MIQKPNLFTSPGPIDPMSTVGLSSGSIKAATKKGQVQVGQGIPPDFIPYVDDSEEKKEFWRATIVTFVVFAAISSLGLGFVISRRLSEPTESLAVQPKYIDSSPSSDSGGKTLVITKKPTKTPTPLVTPTSASRKGPFPTSQFPTGKPSSFLSFIQNPIESIFSSDQLPSATPSAIPGTSTTLTTTPQAATSQTVTPTSTTTPTPTSTASPTATPTPDIYLSTESTSNQILFGATVTGGSSVSQIIYIYNTGVTSFTLSSVSFAATGSTNPFSLSTEDGCITNTALPLTLASGLSKCVKIYFAPTTTTNNSNVLQVFWNSLNINNVAIVGVAVTPTPTYTPTPTITPTPTATNTPTPTP